MELYNITLIVFFGSFLIFPIFFLTYPRSKARKVLLGVQIVLFAYWNIVFWGNALNHIVFWGSALYHDVFGPLIVPENSDPEGSVFMLYLPVTLIYAVFVIVEYLILRRTARRMKNESDPVAQIR
jgi:hypothetical protein